MLWIPFAGEDKQSVDFATSLFHPALITGIRFIAANHEPESSFHLFALAEYLEVGYKFYKSMHEDKVDYKLNLSNYI